MPESVRPILFFAVLIVLLAWETVHPFFDSFRGSMAERGRHLGRNFAVALLNAVLVSVVFVTLWATSAAIAESRGWGLLHQFALPAPARLAIAIVLLDGWTYAWHWMNHRVPMLWRFHRMHHSDAQMDVTTASRFHLGEIAASSLLRIPIILLIGVQLHELVIYEAAMFAVVQFHHANVGLPAWLDRALRVVIVTPAMHKVHHSREVAETNSNYTSLFSFWDRLFGTFRLRADPREIRLGLDEFDAPADQTVAGMLKTPARPFPPTTRVPVVYFAVLAALTLAAACAAFALRTPPVVSWPAIESRIAREFPGVQTIAGADLEQLLRDEASPDVALLDVRQAAEYEVSHLPGAVRIDPNSSPAAFASDWPKDRPIVVYCSVGYRSAAMAQRLTAAGFTNVSNLRGAIFQWANDGRRLVRNGRDVAVVHPYDRQWGALLDASKRGDSPDR